MDCSITPDTFRLQQHTHHPSLPSRRHRGHHPVAPIRAHPRGIEGSRGHLQQPEGPIHQTGVLVQGGDALAMITGLSKSTGSSAALMAAGRSREPSGASAVMWMPSAAGSGRAGRAACGKGRCAKAAAPAVAWQTPHQRALEVDPIVPRNQGGSDDLSNLQALCIADAHSGALFPAPGILATVQSDHEDFSALLAEIDGIGKSTQHHTLRI